MGSATTTKGDKSEPQENRPARSKGKARAADILKAAGKILIDSGYAQLTMRSVADEAGVRLSHLQYYFPTKHDLVRGLTRHVASNYLRNCDSVLSSVPDTPTARFMAWVDFLIDDCWMPQTRRYFIQLWGLLESEDACKGVLLREFYENDVREILKLLRDLSPHMDESELQCRATIIAGMVEGMMLFAGNESFDFDDKALKAETRRQIFKIATEQ